MARGVVLGLIALLTSISAHAENFFEGKTVTVITSTGVGGTYDLTARLIARHMPRYIPGNPTMVVQNMPGGGNLKATNYMYNIAPKDGTTIASIHNAIPLHQVLDGRGVQYDTDKFNWLGSTGPENETIIAWSTAGVTTIQQAKEKEVIVGGTGAGSGIVIIPIAMNAILGTKFKMVSGYEKSEDVNLAMQRGEVQARAFGLGSIITQHPDWIKEKKVAFLAQAGIKRAHQLPDTPLLTELAANDEQRQVMQLISSPPALGRPFIAPPGVPADRLAILRSAFASTLKDKAFLAEAEKLQFEIEPMSADEVAKIVRDLNKAASDVVAKARVAMSLGEQ
jgi:tripartite-type tricarboxylate transporter receptor subunit TctC